MTTQGTRGAEDYKQGTSSEPSTDSTGYSDPIYRKLSNPVSLQTIVNIIALIVFIGGIFVAYNKIIVTYQTIDSKQDQCLIEIGKTHVRIKDTKEQTLQEIKDIHININEKISTQNSKLEFIQRDINDIKYSEKNMLEKFNSHIKQ